MRHQPDVGLGACPGNSPFGGSISIYGIIPATPLFTWALPPQPKYRDTVQQLIGGVAVGVPQILTDPFPVAVYRQIGGDPITSFGLTQNAAGGYFTHQGLTANPGQGSQIISLAVWGSAPNAGTWQTASDIRTPRRQSTRVM